MIGFTSVVPAIGLPFANHVSTVFEAPVCAGVKRQASFVVDQEPVFLPGGTTACAPLILITPTTPAPSMAFQVQVGTTMFLLLINTSITFVASYNIIWEVCKPDDTHSDPEEYNGNSLKLAINTLFGAVPST